jgi:hypothetical protein
MPLVSLPCQFGEGIDGLLLGFGVALTAGAGSGPEAVLLARNLLGLALAMAPVTVSIGSVNSQIKPLASAKAFGGCYIRDQHVACASILQA